MDRRFGLRLFSRLFSCLFLSSEIHAGGTCEDEEVMAL
jgi:hypothetical protein